MLLKCRYLAQFSVGEVVKNSSKIVQEEAKCPFLSFARRTLSTNPGNQPLLVQGWPINLNEIFFF